MSTFISSQAMGFLDFVSNGVDPRTGQYTLSIQLPDITDKELDGAGTALSLYFNPFNKRNSGFGLGWHPNLTEFSADRILSLHSGETFKQTAVTPDGTPVFAENKLKTFVFEAPGDGTYRVIHRSGEVEVLKNIGVGQNQVAVPHRIYAANGNYIDLNYESVSGWQALKSITDPTGTLVLIERNLDNSVVQIHLHPDAGPNGGPLATYTLMVEQQHLRKVVLPSDEQACWRIDYEMIRDVLCVKRLETPTGGRETLEYNDAGHIIPSNPGEPAKPNLPRVTRHLTDPGSGQPVTDVRYAYQSDASNVGHNFHGNGGSVSVVPGLDPLHTAAHTYRYGTTVTLMGEALVNGNKTIVPVRSIARTYSRFHSLIEETTTQGNCVKRELTSYYATSQSFSNQPHQYQLPTQVKTSWQLIDNSSAYREDVITSSYDIHGNLVEKTEADGVKTVFTFYSKDGEPGCPADPYGFERHLKSQRVIPSPNAEPGAPTLQTDYTYQALDAVPGSGLPERLVQASETLLHIDAPGGTPVQMKQLLSTFYTDPTDALTFGRRRRDVDTLNGKSTTTEYSYRKVVSALAGEPVLETTTTLIGFDYVAGRNETIKSMSEQQSLLTGLTLVQTDENGVDKLTRYDALRRVTGEWIAPGDAEFEATRSYEYGLAAAFGDQVWQRTTDAKGVQVLTQFDGLNRRLYEARHEPDRPGGNNGYRQTYAADYNATGEMNTQTHFDWLDDTPLQLTSRFEYSVWGELFRTIGPDGVTTVIDRSPFGKEGPITRSWSQSAEQPPQISGLMVSESNRFGKEAYVTRYDAHPVNKRLASAVQTTPASVIDYIDAALLKNELPVVSSVEYSFNGRGSAVEQREILDNGMERRNAFVYDTWGRVVQTTLPDDTVLIRAYADHVSSELPVSLQVKPADAGKPTVTVGEQTFDGLMRQTQRTVGGRVEQFHFDGGNLQPSKRITPSKREYSFKYEVKLGEDPTEIITPEGLLSYGYDPKTASLRNSDSAQGNQRFVYNAAGQLLSETWVDQSGSRHEISHVSSFQGLPLSRSQSVGPDTLYEYDALGRPRSISQGDLRAVFEYNRLGQQWRTTTTNRHSLAVLVTDRKFDAMGREVLRTLSLTGEPVRTISQDWYADDQLRTRELTVGGLSQLRETFIYDLHNRLINHQCVGPALPRDQFGNPYTRQTFQFDSLSNVERCQTQFANGQNDIATFTYTADGSCQLTRVTHTNTAGGYPALQTFSYDDDGNMLNDELGQRLEYDKLGRLMHVKDASDTQVLSSYRYNGNSELIGVRHGGGSETLRFYEGFSVSHTLQDDRHTHYLFAASVPLGQQQFNAGVIDHEQTMLLLTDASPSVIGEYLQGELHTANYSAYGVRNANDKAMQSMLAFNGEACEPQGWSMLGRGYRAYNPVLMRFHGADSQSPFGLGGLNPYVYCLGNPINFRDPSGHNSTRGHDWDADRRPDPEPLPKPSGLQKWLPLGAAIMGALFAAVFIPYATPIAFTTLAATLASVAKIAGIAALGLSVIAVGLTTAGILKDDQRTQDFGTLLGYIAGVLGLISAMAASFSAWLAGRAGAKVAASTQTMADDVTGATTQTVASQAADAVPPPMTQAPPPNPLGRMPRRSSEPFIPAPDYNNTPSGSPGNSIRVTDTTRRMSDPGVSGSVGRASNASDISRSGVVDGGQVSKGIRELMAKFDKPRESISSLAMRNKGRPFAGTDGAGRVTNFTRQADLLPNK